MILTSSETSVKPPVPIEPRNVLYCLQVCSTLHVPLFTYPYDLRHALLECEQRSTLNSLGRQGVFAKLGDFVYYRRLPACCLAACAVPEISTYGPKESAYMEQAQVTIAPARGKLGVLLPGMGAVSTTVIAGVELIKKGLGRPIGSLTQYGTIRLGKRTDHNSPRIKDFISLAELDDLVFGCWDIFEDNCYEAALHAGVIEPTRLEAVRPELKR